MREELFVAYSRADAEWRDRFVEQLESVVSHRDLFVDRDSIPGGADWEREITDAISRARCALLLLTGNYLKIDDYARDKELRKLLDAHKAGHLKLLPSLSNPVCGRRSPNCAKCS
jgi:TIR domain